MRLSSQLARTLHTQGRQRIARCGATVIATSGAHVNRRITHAVQAAVRLAPNTYAHITIVATDTYHVTLRAQSQHGCSSQVQAVLRNANCGTPVITPRARLAIPTSLTRRKLRCDRPRDWQRDDQLRGAADVRRVCVAIGIALAMQLYICVLIRL